MPTKYTFVKTDSLRLLCLRDAPPSIGPYCQATKYNGTIYSTGCIGLHPKTQEVVDGGIEALSRRIMLNAQAPLEASGSSFDNVVKVTLLLKDLKDFAAFSVLYAEYFKVEAKPARSCVEVTRLPQNVLYEMAFIALVE
ncbi:hypothetical protein I314_03410 [Cryptococcus bacillisporus CA1873]|uniref:Uncharacterized protein n=1 Tax=Cryptococcus bacillisporus CA1873 TaxID=1296111 RepID=A0ABR5BBA6_CRYGA|nr:hypothetical protein I314_03410 [Cryptococcus bacillisporus CA1873]|eukprot:KIR62467.1 hypothetical protein I314_03410 [Cryptococcus gattii CA1873]